MIRWHLRLHALSDETALGKYYDIFNGDADGLLALHQLRLHEPRDAERITGVKRDIELVARVEARAGDRVTVLDVSLDKNRDALLRIRVELGFTRLPPPGVLFLHRKLGGLYMLAARLRAKVEVRGILERYLHP